MFNNEIGNLDSIRFVFRCYGRRERQAYPSLCFNLKFENERFGAPWGTPQAVNLGTTFILMLHHCKKITDYRLELSD
jgi:hypothetical protein